MAKKLYEEASVQDIAAAIREKNGTATKYKVDEMAGAVRKIISLQAYIEEYSQVNDVVSQYLAAANAAYTDGNGGSVSVLDSYAAAKDAPRGKALSTRAGTRYLQDEATGKGGKINNILNGESVIYNAIPGHVLSYMVKDGDGNVIDNGRVKPTGTVRMMKFIGYVKNCRDIGGWACDGGTVKYGLMYRCAAPGAAEAANADIAKNANIRYHFDLRNESSFTSSPFGSEVYYKSYPLSAYYSDLVDLTKSNYGGVVTLLRSVFDAVTHGDGVIYHCSLGRDRTGTLSFILLALLGVAKKNIDIDYELTGFSSLSDAGTPQKRTSTNYNGLANYFASFGKSTLCDNVVKWALKAGMTIDELNAYRAAAVDGTPSVLNASDYVTQYTLTQNLTDCTSNVSLTAINEGEALSMTISPNAGKKIGSITVTMGGTDVSASAVSGNTITIAKVTGDIAITCAAVITNIIDTIGISANTRLSASSGDNRTQSGYAAIGANKDAASLIHLVDGDTLRIKGVSLPTSNDSYSAIALYNASGTFNVATYLHNGLTWNNLTFNNADGGVTITSDSDHYFRVSLICTDASAVIATINEPIK